MNWQIIILPIALLCILLIIIKICIWTKKENKTQKDESLIFDEFSLFVCDELNNENQKNKILEYFDKLQEDSSNQTIVKLFEWSKKENIDIANTITTLNHYRKNFIYSVDFLVSYYIFSLIFGYKNSFESNNIKNKKFFYICKHVDFYVENENEQYEMIYLVFKNKFSFFAGFKKTDQNLEKIKYIFDNFDLDIHEKNFCLEKENYKKVFYKIYDKTLEIVNEYKLKHKQSNQFNYEYNKNEIVCTSKSLYKKYCSLLNISENSDLNQIKSAYRKMAKKYHPDYYKEKDSNLIMSQINEAYVYLINHQ